MSARRLPRGFTLVELVFAIAILAILAGLAMPMYRDYLDRARSSAFLVQLDAWRSKAAAEAAAFGADLCRWDDRKYGAMRAVIFGQAKLDDAQFGDYTFALAPRDVGASAGSTARPFVVDVVATATDGPAALNVARLLRGEVERVGLRHVSPATDRDLASMQSFSVLLGNCSGASGTTPPPVVGGIVVPVKPPRPPAVTGGTGASAPVVPSVPASAPALPASAPPVPASAPAVTASAPVLLPAASQPLQPPAQPQAVQSPVIVPPTQPTPVCTGGRQLSADGTRCYCAVGNWNAQHQRCVGNNRH